MDLTQFAGAYLVMLALLLAVGYVRAASRNFKD